MLALALARAFALLALSAHTDAVNMNTLWRSGEIVN
jgi:hypothetical protein